MEVGEEEEEEEEEVEDSRDSDTKGFEIPHQLRPVSPVLTSPCSSLISLPPTRNNIRLIDLTQLIQLIYSLNHLLTTLLLGTIVVCAK